MALKISFEGKRVLITGTARGLGKDLVSRLHEQGAFVYAISRNAEGLKNLKKEFPNIKTACADLSDWKEAREAVKSFGSVDYLINNAGLFYLSPFMDIEEGELNRMMSVNVKAVFNVSQIVAQDMIERGEGGSIVNISSMAAFAASKSCGAYCCSKAALDSLTRSMAVELGPYNIRVNSVNPTLFPTDMTKNFLSMFPDGGAEFQARTPMKRIAVSSEVVNTILFIMSDKAGMLNASSVLIDGGFMAN